MDSNVDGRFIDFNLLELKHESPILSRIDSSEMVTIGIYDLEKAAYYIVVTESGIITYGTTASLKQLVDIVYSDGGS